MSNFNQFIKITFAEDERSRWKKLEPIWEISKMASRSSLKTIQANEAMALGKFHKLFSSLLSLGEKSMSEDKMFDNQYGGFM